MLHQHLGHKVQLVGFIVTIPQPWVGKLLLTKIPYMPYIYACVHIQCVYIYIYINLQHETLISKAFSSGLVKLTVNFVS